MKLRDKKVTIGLIAGIALLVGLYAFEIPRLYSVVMYADDFHYWASGAFWAGIDWSGMVRHDFYYSYGYGLLLAPLFAFTQDGIILFRMGILLNYVFLAFSYWLLVKTGMVIYEKVSRLKICCVCLAVCLYPSWRIYVSCTMSEALLYFLFILTLFLMVKVERGSSIGCAVSLGFLAVYIYMVHQRMLSVTIAVTCVMVILYLLKKINRYHFWDYLFTVLFSFGAHRIIKPVFQDFLYVNYSTLELDREPELKRILAGIWLQIVILYLLLAGMLFIIHKTKILQSLRKYRIVLLAVVLIFFVAAMGMALGTMQDSAGVNNDYASILRKFTGVFTKGNFIPVLRTVMGHIFYAFVASGGMAIYVFICFMIDILRTVKSKKWHQNQAMELYLLFTVILIGGLSCLFIGGKSTSRIDALIYGRYYEFVMPALLMVGLLKIGKEGMRWREFMASGLLFSGTVYFVYAYYKQGEVFDLFKDTRFLSTNSPALYWEFSVRHNGVIAAFLVGIIFAIICMFTSSFQNKILPYIFYLLLGVFWGIQGKSAIEAYVMPQQELQNEGNVIAEIIMDQYMDYQVFFMREENDVFHCSAYYQVRMPKVHMLSLRDEQVADIEGKCIVICDVGDLDSRTVLEEAEFRILEECATSVCYMKNGE